MKTKQIILIVITAIFLTLGVASLIYSMTQEGTKFLALGMGLNSIAWGTSNLLRKCKKEDKRD